MATVPEYRHNAKLINEAQAELIALKAKYDELSEKYATFRASHEKQSEQLLQFQREFALLIQRAKEDNDNLKRALNDIVNASRDEGLAHMCNWMRERAAAALGNSDGTMFGVIEETGEPATFQWKDDRG